MLFYQILKTCFRSDFVILYNSFTSEDEAMDRDDFALDEAWTEMNVALKLVDEHLIPLLAEAISQEPSKYASLTNWLTSQLEKLGTALRIDRYCMSWGAFPKYVRCCEKNFMSLRHF